MKEVKISKDNLELDGKTFFDNFLSDLNVTEKADFIIEKDDSIKENTSDFRIYKQLSTIIKKIKDEINNVFNHRTDEVDAFLDNYED
jgi:hypothetical protein